MKIPYVFLLAVSGLLAAVAYGDEPKSYRVQLNRGTIGTAEVAAGEYKMLVHRDGGEPKVRLTEVKTGNSIEVAGKVESGDQKFDQTQVHSREENGASQITEIRIGGTKLRVDFQQGSSL